MSPEFYLGLALGAAVTYLVRNVMIALEGPKDELQKKLNECMLQAIRRDAELVVNDYTHEELVRAIGAGLKSIPPRDNKPR